MARWIDPSPLEVPPELHLLAGGHRLLAYALTRRGIRSVEQARSFLDPHCYVPAPATDLPGLEASADRIRDAIRRGELIAIWGDFDADGQTATALLFETLQALGARVVFRVPTRDEGHGIHIGGLEHLIADGARLIVTCDTGISAHAALALAASRGVDVIVTDHHIPPGRLPAALTIVNPHMLPDGHPMCSLSGVGVAFQLTRCLDPLLAQRALDLVAIGTVADVATLTDDNRYLVQLGLEALRQTGRPGLEAIFRAAELRRDGITEEHVAYVLAPRLNALGRLADAALGVELLTSPDAERARVLATEVESLNSRRQWLTKQVTDAALAQIDRQPDLLADYAALVLSHPSWPIGVLGIVAGRLAERCGKPALLIATPDGRRGLGSARSVPGVDLMAALDGCAYLLESHGGHAAAAGIHVEPERIPELRAALSRAVVERAGEAKEPVLQIDAYVRLADLTLELVSGISRLAPFGPGNPHLVLAVSGLHSLGQVTIGRMAEHRRLTVEDLEGNTQTVFWWQGGAWPLPRDRFDLACTVRATDYRGVAEVQVEWIEARELPEQTGEIRAPLAFQVHDLRAASRPEQSLRKLLAQGDLQVFAEARVPPGVQTLTRQQLHMAPRLAIWTCPPGPRELRVILDEVQPREVFLFCLDPGRDAPRTFLTGLAGLVKYALNARQGQVDLESAAAAMGHRTRAVEVGLEWLFAQGQIAVTERLPDHWQVSLGSGSPAVGDAEAAIGRLEALLDETAAFRDYARKAPAAALLARGR